MMTKYEKGQVNGICLCITSILRNEPKNLDRLLDNDFDLTWGEIIQASEDYLIWEKNNQIEIVEKWLRTPYPLKDRWRDKYQPELMELKDGFPFFKDDHKIAEEYFKEIGQLYITFSEERYRKLEEKKKKAIIGRKQDKIDFVQKFLATASKQAELLKLYQEKEILVQDYMRNGQLTEGENGCWLGLEMAIERLERELDETE